jgi:hypothetical protein
MIKRIVVAVAVVQTPDVVATMQKAVSLDQRHHNREHKDRTAQQEVQVVDLVEPMEDQGTQDKAVVAWAIVPLEVVQVRLLEVAESIDILKDRQFQ